VFFILAVNIAPRGLETPSELEFGTLLYFFCALFFRLLSPHPLCASWALPHCSGFGDPLPTFFLFVFFGVFFVFSFGVFGRARATFYCAGHFSQSFLPCAHFRCAFLLNGSTPRHCRFFCFLVRQSSTCSVYIVSRTFCFHRFSGPSTRVHLLLLIQELLGPCVLYASTRLCSSSGLDPSWSLNVL